MGGGHNNVFFLRFSLQGCVYPRTIHSKTLKGQNLRIYKVVNSMQMVLLYTSHCAHCMIAVRPRSAKFTISVGPSSVRYYLSAQ